MPEALRRERAVRHNCQLAGTAAVLLVLTHVPSHAQKAPAVAPDATAITLPPTEVIARPLLPGLPDLDTIPSAAQVFDREYLRRDGSPSVLRSLDAGATGVSLGQAQGNPWQPNLLYRGFEASPLVGNAQGLAVYLNGSRFNQPFGDTTNWDLFPNIAIDRVDVVGANPAFGLNALGGAIAVRLKDGFNYQGAELEMSGGSFRRIQGSLQYGVQSNDVSTYIASTNMRESGWRDFSPSSLQQFYADIGMRTDKAEWHVNIMGANNDLVGNGTTPVELLSVSRSAIFTHPDQTLNRYIRVGLSGTHAVTENISLQVNSYYSNLSQRTKNGDAGEAAPCADDLTIVCQEGHTPLTGRGGIPIPNFVTGSPYFSRFGFEQFRNGGPYSFLNRTATDTSGYGAQAQLTHTFDILSMPNRLTVGASYDGGNTGFRASTTLGGLSLDRGFVGPGFLVDQADGSITPVRLRSTNNYYGLFMTNTLDITPKMAATVSARFNAAQIQLHDQIGTDLDGAHAYNHFNPAVGLTYKILPNLTAYAGYAVTNRAPTPAELSCADPLRPCSLNNFFVGDPDLKQVVSRTFEAGLRGYVAFDRTSKLDWNLGLFRADNSDDILFVSSETIGRAFFRNVGSTRRQGIEAGARLRMGRLLAYANYAFTDATFQTALTLSSENNPRADADGNIHVVPGNRLPRVPRHMFKSGADYDISDDWTIGFSALFASGRYLLGDESNLNRTTAAYGALNIHSSYQIGKHIQLFAMVENVLNSRYATFGTFSPVSRIPLIQVPGAANTRSFGPAPPISAFGGLRITF